MQVIAVTSQKGGSGKTTLCGHLAVQAERAGAGPVALVDTDPQGSLSVWWNARPVDTPVFARTYVSQLPDALAELAEKGIELVVIDTPPAITTTIVEVVRCADLVIIPVRPSPHDLSAAGATVELVEQLDKRLVFVVNGASARARITGEAAIALSQHGTVAPAIVHQRTDFAASMIDGRTVMELPKAERSAAEIEELWAYVAQQLGKSIGDKRLPTGHTIRQLETALSPSEDVPVSPDGTTDDATGESVEDPTTAERARAYR